MPRQSRWWYLWGMKRPTKKEIIITLILLAGFAIYLMIPKITFLYFYRITNLPKDVWIENYHTNAPAMDNHYLWELRSDSNVAIKAFIDSIEAKEVQRPSIANCLSFSGFNENHPTWLRSQDLNEALWDNNSSPYRLYRKKLEHGVVCIYLHGHQKTAFFSWFDPP